MITIRETVIKRRMEIIGAQHVGDGRYILPFNQLKVVENKPLNFMQRLAIKLLKIGMDNKICLCRDGLELMYIPQNDKVDGSINIWYGE